MRYSKINEGKTVTGDPCPYHGSEHGRLFSSRYIIYMVFIFYMRFPMIIVFYLL